jgi:hypothetical protein
MRSTANKMATIATTLALVAALAAPAQAHKPRRAKQGKGTLIVNTYVQGTARLRQGQAEPPPEPIPTGSIRVYSNHVLIREVEPTSSRTLIELKPGHYVVRAECGGAKAVVRPDRTTTASVLCLDE